MVFPSELDGFLDRSIHQHNFDFDAVSAELKECGSGFIRHPDVDEPDDMVEQRAEAIFSPAALRAHWEERNGMWEAPVSPDTNDRQGSWEVVPEENWVIVADETRERPGSAAPMEAITLCTAIDTSVGSLDPSFQSALISDTLPASTDDMISSKLAKIFWQDTMPESVEEGSDDEDEIHYFEVQRRHAKVREERIREEGI